MVVKNNHDCCGILGNFMRGFVIDLRQSQLLSL
jgi:hypothetical protein